jgi:pimeloyl-ACP methyl ester carboxylesterase
MPVAHLNDTELFYVEVGEGLPCLVMHGGLGGDHSSLHPWLDPLGDVMRLVYYDHRGNGRSGRPRSDSITFEQLCADADALREHLGFEEIAVLGYSFGGLVALEYALRYPERISHLILLDTAPTFDYEEEIEANARRKGATQEQLEALGASAEDEGESWTSANFAYTEYEVRAAFRRVRSCVHGGKDDPLGKRGRKEHQICLRLYAITRRILRPSTRWFGGCRKTLCPSSGTCGGLSPTSS